MERVGACLTGFAQPPNPLTLDPVLPSHLPCCRCRCRCRCCCCLQVLLEDFLEALSTKVGALLQRGRRPGHRRSAPTHAAEPDR